ncbi:MAG: HEAT repeat domain-containing protein [Pirellulaceae bacterium]
MPCRRFLAAFAVLLAAAGSLTAQQTPPPEEPVVSPASDEAASAAEAFQKPEAWQVQLFAAEPHVANPVAFGIDAQGRVYVCESFRQGKGIEDNRKHNVWLDDDLAAQTVEDRLAYIKKHLGENAIDYTKNDDRIRLLTDTDGDGRADASTVFANHFNNILDGTGASVLARGGDVYYTCIPHLWRLKDADGDGQADQRESLYSGYGVRFAFRGHDMHGLIVGPDGKLYFSIGDRGYHVVTDDGRTLHDPESGAVFRCNLDGSELEVFATGLRNPQELAFDDYGNLFTGDNNSDSGDKARWVYVVEGGDTGWRMAYQYLADRGPFNREKIWHPQHEGQPAYIVPPIANLADGPSGLAYYPGTGLSDHYNGRFFLCDFRGNAGRSGIRTFRVKPKGAFFELVDQEQTIWNILATDVDFGPDGGVYVSDWVDGWTGVGQGRIYRFFDPAHAQKDETNSVASLLRDGFSQRSVEQLQTLLSHADRRVRQESQFALIDKAKSGEETALAALTSTARSSDDLLARLHAVWGLAQIDAADPLIELLEDDDDEVRAQAAKLLGEIDWQGERSAAAANERANDRANDRANERLIALLADESLRVRYFAANSLGKLGRDESVPALLAMLDDNATGDPVLRHGGVMGLVGCADRAALESAADHSSAAVRMGVLLAMRRKQIPSVAGFLQDGEPTIVMEAARAIHDVPIAEAMPDLAALISRPSTDDALLRRVLNANYRQGGAENAAALAHFAGSSEAPEAMRLEALAMLEHWAEPSPRDRVLNMWRPLPPRDRQTAVDAVKAALPGILASSGKVQSDGAKLAARYGIQDAAPVLRQVLADEKLDAATRGDALDALARLDVSDLDASILNAMESQAPALRAVARRVLADRKPELAVSVLAHAVLTGELVERQSALETLATIKSAAAEDALRGAVEKLLAGEIPADTRLDVVLAAQARGSDDLQELLVQYEAAAPADNPLAKYRDTLEGGDADRGRRIFFERTEVSCVRCHRVDGSGGDVGPELSKVGLEKKRDYLLEAVVDPNRAIAKGFESVLVADDEGRIFSGIVRHEDDKILRLMTPEGRQIDINQNAIEARRAGKSAMPEDLVKQLSLADIRDLVAFLSSLQNEQAGQEHK